MPGVSGKHDRCRDTIEHEHHDYSVFRIPTGLSRCWPLPAAGPSLRLRQHLTLTPQVQQALRLLQMSALEFAQEMEQAREKERRTLMKALLSEGRDW